MQGGAGTDTAQPCKPAWAAASRSDFPGKYTGGPVEMGCGESAPGSPAPKTRPELLRSPPGTGRGSAEPGEAPTRIAPGSKEGRHPSLRPRDCRGGHSWKSPGQSGKAALDEPQKWMGQQRQRENGERKWKKKEREKDEKKEKVSGSKRNRVRAKEGKEIDEK